MVSWKAIGIPRKILYAKSSGVALVIHALKSLFSDNDEIVREIWQIYNVKCVYPG